MSWSHFRELLPLEKPLQRDFYAEMCRVEGWSVRTLRRKIDSMLYERTAISRKPEAVIRHDIDALRKKDQLTPAGNQMNDPVVLAKKEACRANTSNHTCSHGGKPWRYVLIPHNEIATNITLDALATRFGA